MRRLTSGCCLLLLSAGAAAAAGSDVADAVMNKDQEQVRSLLQKKADLNAPQADGTTALQWAVRQDNLALVDLLIRGGADVNAANHDGATALYLACLNGSAPMAEKLLKAGVNPNTTFLMHGDTALMEAARTGNVE